MTKGGKGRTPQDNRGWRLLPVMALLVLFLAALARAYLSPGASAAGLAARVDASLAAGGVGSRVTAVLLNFRAYDTLLECFVLLLGVMVVWSLWRPDGAASREPAAGAILASLERLLVPLMIMVGSYLLWAGSDRAGGAFQAGAILGGAGVLLLLDSSPLLNIFPKKGLGPGICLGPLFFLSVGIATMAWGGNFLEYRSPEAALIIIALEGAAAFSIGLCLAVLFGGRPPEPEAAEGRDESGRNGEECR
ncbi:MAG: MnhB domain-containing protein [Desulfurivibrionaceae bacterium]